jgi:serine/threonine protein kinase
MPELKLGPYRILDEIGSGGMGVVYRAYDERLEREVALKVVPLDGHAARRDRARLFEEARAASSLAHPGIVSIFDVGEALTTIGSSDGAAEERLVGWIAMERVVGRTLEAVFQEGPVPLPRLLALLTPVADALARAHASGLVHRDVKPANVMVTADGFPKVLDFGLAQREIVSGVDRTLVKTREGMVVGTAAYMSPEQASGQAVDFRSDQFSFGAVLFEGLTGQRPFTGRNDVDVMHAILHADPPPTRLLAPARRPVCWISASPRSRATAISRRWISSST